MACRVTSYNAPSRSRLGLGLTAARGLGPAGLLLLGGPLDGRIATAAGHLAGELDLAAGDLALVIELDVLIANLGVDREGDGIALHLAIVNGRFTGEGTYRLAGDLSAFLLEGEGPLERAVRPFRRCLPVAADIRGQCAEGE